MKIVYSARVRTELDRYFSDGVAQFGLRVAERTFSKIRRAFEVTLVSQPYMVRRIVGSAVHKYVVSSTPFVAYYEIDEEAGTVTILAIFHGAQLRKEFEKD